ncbi:dynamin family protein [Malonomonas rubra]|uniref:dynamin family protein n=1 Tax=Malonomonas rubra TaxID=57040 RepID=UPI0026ECC35D|nr:dynamin family protein [Malonomonas rubra]
MVDQKVEEGGSSKWQSEANLSELLQQAHSCLAALGENYSRFGEEFSSLQQRLGEGRFHLAVLGQFKRGKSTLLNALLGEELLPTDILPVTAIPTFVHAGDKVSGEVYFNDNKEPQHFDISAESSLAAFLYDYVTEAGNPYNQRHVCRVEISHPSPLLQQGVVLIDTPGVGSTLKHNTEIAHQVLSQCDAALFLVSPDPPITVMELDYLQQIKEHLPRTFYLLNKVDFLSVEEQASSIRFLVDQLSRFYDAPPQVMPISARKGLRSRLAGDEEGWRQSGMQLVEQNLIDFFAREKQQTLLQALRRRGNDLLNSAIMQLQLSLKALKLPESELQLRMDQFRHSLPAIEREQQAAADVLAGDLKRVIKRLGEEVEAVRERAKQQILGQIETHLESVADVEQMEQLVQETVATQTEQFFAPAMNAVADVIRREATELLRLNQQRSDQLMEQVRQTAAELFEIPYHAPVAGKVYTSFEPPAWSYDLFTSDMDPLGQKLSRKLFSKKFRYRRTVKRLREESRKLVNQNVAQIDWALRKSLDKSFRQFGTELRDQLDKTIEATRKAMSIALQRSESHSATTAANEVRLQQTLQQLETVRQQMGTDS